MHKATVRPTAGASTVTCPAPWLGAWGLEPGQTVRLGFGQRSIQATVAVSSGRRATAWLSAAARRQLRAPTGIPLNLIWRSGGLQLGPLIGVLTSLRLTGPSPSPERLGPQAAFFAHLCRVGRRQGSTVFIFGPEQVRWGQGEVIAVVWQGSRWRRAILPLPDAVYLRTQSRSADRRRDVVACLSRLEKIPGMVLFNRSFFDKWELHQALSGHPEAEQLLPETRRYTGPHDLTEMLARHRQVFVKPDGGSLGIGIIRIRRLPGMLFEYRLSLRSGDRTRVFGSAAAVARQVQMTVRRRRYIVQQGLNLARAGGAAFDIRMLVQKDRHGQWSVTSGVARLAAPGRLATNVFLGGEAVGATRVLRSALGAAAPNRQQMGEAARLVAGALEEQLGTPLGEVGVDFGVDHAGRIWVIEANSRPARNWPWPPGPAAPRSVRILLEHLLFATGFLSSGEKGGSV